MSAAGVIFRQSGRVMTIGTLLLVYAALSACSSDVAVAAPDPGKVIVILKDLDPKVKRAVGRVIQTGETATLKQGRLSFQACENDQNVSVWAPGYYIKTLICNGSIDGYYEISMDRIDPADNPSYPWVSADPRFNSIGCAKCHSDASLLNEYPEWDIDGHSRAFVRPLFWTTYLGTNINRAPGQRTL